MPEDHLKGVIERVVYAQEGTDFRVLRVRTDDGALVKVVGGIGDCSEGMRIDAYGYLGIHPEHGPQFKVKTLLLSSPEQTEELARYLASARIKGIGPKTAKMITDFFGKDLKQVLDTQPWRLTEVPGIGKSKAEAIIAAWYGDREKARIMARLIGLGLNRSQADRVYEKYREKAAHIASSDPYRLADEIWGIGFRTADEVALAGGVKQDSPKRIRAAIFNVLSTAAGEGHCFMPQELVVAHTAGMLGLDEALIEPQLQYLIKKGRVVLDRKDRVYPKALYVAEQEVAKRVLTLAAMEFPKARQVKAAFMAISRPFHPTQIQAGAQVFSAGVNILTGGPGTGKTTLTRALAEAGERAGLKVKLCSPTGRAAKNLSEATGKTAMTIHRMLDFDPVEFAFRRNPENPLDADWVIVDEASMVDIRLMHSLIIALRPGAALTLIGDRHQLPPVGPGAPFHDMVNNPALPTAELTVVFRQGGGSRIVAAARGILDGQAPEPTGKSENLEDFYFIPIKESDKALDVILDLVGNRIPKRFGFDPKTDIQVLVPTYKGRLGADNLNRELRRTVLGVETEKRFVEGDRVLQIRNNYDKNVFNGDIGKIISISNNLTNIDFDGHVIPYTMLDLDEITLAYAITVHKSQGSEFPCVVVVLSTQHMIMLRRSLLYTAITRGKQLVVMVAHPYAVQVAVQNAEGINRNTGLRELLGMGA